MSALIEQLMPRAADTLRWLLIAGIAYTLATTALYFLGGPGESTAEPVVNNKVTNTSVKPVSVEQIIAKQLFGSAKPGAKTQTAVAAVETRLPLELVGVFQADDANESAAIVAQKGKPGILYKVGEVMPGSAKLLEVFPDHIVLSRAGVREVLRFPKTAGAFEAQDNPQAAQIVSAQINQGPPQSAKDFVDRYRQQLESQPEAVLDQLGLQPVKAGANEGYKLGNNLAQSPYLSQTGLQPGDVILSVNGRPIGDVQQDRMEMDNILTQGSARIEVQRGSRRFFVTASLK